MEGCLAETSGLITNVEELEKAADLLIGGLESIFEENCSLKNSYTMV